MSTYVLDPKLTPSENAARFARAEAAVQARIDRLAGTFRTVDRPVFDLSLTPDANQQRFTKHQAEANRMAEEAIRADVHRKAVCEAVPVQAATDSFLPTSAEHAVWITQTPEKFLHSTFKSEIVAAGIRCITAELREELGQREAMAYFFDQTKFTQMEAQAWCSEKGLAVADFVPSKEANYPQVTAQLRRTFTGVDVPARIIRAKGRLPRIDIDPLYSGGELNLDGFPVPLVVELGGITIDDPISILYAHDDAEPIGQGVATIAAGVLTVDGEITGTGDRAKQVIDDAANGYVWRASMGCELIGESQIIKPGENLYANGQTFKGPLIYWPKSRLKEASVLGNGADHTSRVSIAAKAK